MMSVSNVDPSRGVPGRSPASTGSSSTGALQPADLSAATKSLTLAQVKKWAYKALNYTLKTIGIALILTGAIAAACVLHGGGTGSGLLAFVVFCGGLAPGATCLWLSGKASDRAKLAEENKSSPPAQGPYGTS